MRQSQFITIRSYDKIYLAFMAKRVLFILFFALTAFSCQKQIHSEKAVASLEPFISYAPAGLPSEPFPPANPPTKAEVELGRRLFYDPQLSSDNTISCASCHNPALFFTDGLPVAKGINGQLATRNSPSLVNAVFNSSQFLDGRAANLEAQAGEPIANPREMNLSHEECVAKLNSIPSYREEFKKVFGSDAITMGRISNAIANFERMIVSGNSPFDQYQYGENKKALSPAAIRGLEVFTNKDKGNCATCHTVGEKSALFTDGQFHNLGAGMDANGELKDLGRFNQTKVENDKGAFRTPSLRHIAKTAPYMHDGSLKTLKEVIDFYIGGGSSNPQLDKEIKPLILSAQEREDLIVFLESLTGEIPANVGAPEKK